VLGNRAKWTRLAARSTFEICFPFRVYKLLTFTTSFDIYSCHARHSCRTA